MSSPDIAARDLRDISFEEFARPGIFRSIQSIARFSFRAKLGYAGRWGNSDEPKRISQKLYYYLLGILRATEFNEPQKLEVLYQEGSFRINYTDPEYGFDIHFTESGWLQIQRSGSSVERFHEWYTRLMPSLQGIIETVKSAVNEEISRTTGVNRSDVDEQDFLQLQQAGYEFEVIAYNFQRTNARERSGNLELMMRALTQLPDDKGRLSQSANLEPESFGRINYSVGKWTGSGDTVRREIYEASAPSNNEWSSIWFTFSYIGDSFTTPSGNRHAFVDRDFTTSRGAMVPYVEFWRNRALCGFVQTLTEGYAFQTTPDVLP